MFPVKGEKVWVGRGHEQTQLRSVSKRPGERDLWRMVMMVMKTPMNWTECALELDQVAVGDCHSKTHSVYLGVSRRWNRRTDLATALCGHWSLTEKRWNDAEDRWVVAVPTRWRIERLHEIGFRQHSTLSCVRNWLKSSSSCVPEHREVVQPATEGMRTRVGQRWWEVTHWMRQYSKLIVSL